MGRNTTRARMPCFNAAMAGAQIHDADFVNHRLHEAGRTLLALPNRGCLPSGYKSNWPAHAWAAAEAYGYGDDELQRIRPAAPSAKAIDRMDECFRWVTLIPEDRLRDRRLVLLRCLVHPVTERHLNTWRRLGERFGTNDKQVKRWHSAAIDLIVQGLRRADAAAARAGAEAAFRLPSTPVRRAA